MFSNRPGFSNQPSIGPGQHMAHRSSWQGMNQELDGLERGHMSAAEFIGSYAHVVPQDRRSQQYLSDMAHDIANGQATSQEKWDFASWMNNSSYNLRPGDASINQSIGGHFDPGIDWNTGQLSPRSSQIVDDRRQNDQYTSFRHDPRNPGHYQSSTHGSFPSNYVDATYLGRGHAPNPVSYGGHTSYSDLPTSTAETHFQNPGETQTVEQRYRLPNGTVLTDPADVAAALHRENAARAAQQPQYLTRTFQDTRTGEIWTERTPLPGSEANLGHAEPGQTARALGIPGGDANDGNLYVMFNGTLWPKDPTGRT